jgi:archaellum component FlaG (FlaF/FlaG flagellin family)
MTKHYTDNNNHTKNGERTCFLLNRYPGNIENMTQNGQSRYTGNIENMTQKLFTKVYKSFRVFTEGNIQHSWSRNDLCIFNTIRKTATGIL